VAAFLFRRGQWRALAALVSGDRPSYPATFFRASAHIPDSSEESASGTGERKGGKNANMITKGASPALVVTALAAVLRGQPGRSPSLRATELASSLWALWRDNSAVVPPVAGLWRDEPAGRQMTTRPDACRGGRSRRRVGEGGSVRVLALGLFGGTQNSSSWAIRGVSKAKRNWRSALQDASRSGLAAGAPTGLGVRARQRRFPARARRFVREPINQSHALYWGCKRLEEFCLTFLARRATGREVWRRFSGRFRLRSPLPPPCCRGPVTG